MYKSKVELRYIVLSHTGFKVVTKMTPIYLLKIYLKLEDYRARVNGMNAQVVEFLSGYELPALWSLQCVRNREKG